MNAEVITTANFQKNARRLIKKYHSLKNELNDLAEELTAKPNLGTSLGNGCYKIRLAIKSKGKGKSGGARVITNYRILNNTIYLLSIYDKSELDTISDNDLRQLIRKLS